MCLDIFYASILNIDWNLSPNLIIFGFDDTVINFHVLYLYVLTRGLLYYVPYCENILTEVSIIQFSCKGIF